MQPTVFDANIWVSSLRFPGSVPDLAIDTVRVGRFASVTSPAIIDQVRRALAGPKFRFSDEEVDAAEASIRRLSLLVHPTIRLAVITAKESDNRVLVCAVEGNADVIVTGDRKHLLRLGSYRGIPIVSPRDFLDSR